MERHLEHSELDFIEEILYQSNKMMIFWGGQAENLHNFHNTQEPLQFRVDAGIEGYSITVAWDRSGKAYSCIRAICLYTVFVCKCTCVYVFKDVYDKCIFPVYIIVYICVIMCIWIYIYIYHVGRCTVICLCVYLPVFLGDWQSWMLQLWTWRTHKTHWRV